MTDEGNQIANGDFSLDPSNLRSLVPLSIAKIPPGKDPAHPRQTDGIR